jgi:nucleoside-diphosphate-sugar epimerase
MTKLIFGCGYLGKRVARRWHDARETIFMVTRSSDRAAEFSRQGYRPIVADVTQQGTLKNVPTVEMVLFAIGHDHGANQSIHDVYAGGIQNVLAALPTDVERFIYISTTGVYGPAGGEWVDEETPPDPRRDGGKASLAAEQVLATHPLGRRSVILRLAGIYGPGRIPFLNELRAARPIPAPKSGYLNLIHVDDAAAAVVAAGQLPDFDNGPRVYCVSDGHPILRDDYYREVARQIGAPPPTFVAPNADSPRALRAEANRRVRNDRMLHELGVKLAYPDYRAGLTAILETQNQ